MKIIDRIKLAFGRGELFLRKSISYCFDYFGERRRYSDLIWFNICELVTDLINDVELIYLGVGNEDKVADFKLFVKRKGKTILHRIYDLGFVVVAYNKEHNYFSLLDSDDYYIITEAGRVMVRVKNSELEAHIIRSTTYEVLGMSDKELCKSWLDFLDDVTNGSATTSQRLGTLLVATPKTSNQSPVTAVLNKSDKDELEKEMQRDYGMLRSQKQMMILPRDMNFQTIDLASADKGFSTKVRACILAIADRLKIPANQIAMIDAMSSKAFANGSEMLAGDFAKYQTFERLFQQVFLNMANVYDLRFDYTIYNKPKLEVTE